MKIRIILLSALFATAIILGSWLAINITKNMLAKNHLVKNSSDFFMKDIEYTQIDNTGGIQNQLHAVRMTHYPNSDSYSFAAPLLIMQDKAGQSWYISAKHGSSTNNGEKVYIWEDVNIRQQKMQNDSQKAEDTLPENKKSTTNNEASGISGMKIITSAATIYPKQKTAETNKPLIIVQGQNIVGATGAKVDFQNSTVKLLSQVKGKYAKNKKSIPIKHERHK